MYRLILCFCVAACGCFLCLGSAWAADSSDADKEKAAIAAFDEGAKAYFAKDYPRAIVHFQEALSLQESGFILYNLALAYARLDNLGEALELTKRAADVGDLPAKAAARNDARGVGFGSVLDARVIAKDIFEVPEPLASLVGPENDTDWLSNPIFSTPLFWVGAGSAGAGLVGLTVSLALANSANSKEEDYLSNPPGSQKLRVTTVEEINSDRSAGRGFLLVGAPLTVLGLSLVAYEWFDNPEDGRQLSLDVDVDRFGFRYSSSF
jgi:hypothetical protein